MANVYITRCIVKKGGKQYKKGEVIENLTAKEIKQGLNEKWLEKVGSDDDEKEQKTSHSVKLTPEQKKRKALLEKVKELGIVIDDSMSDEEIQEKIKEGNKRKGLLVQAAKLGLAVDDKLTNDEILALIAKAKKE